MKNKKTLAVLLLCLSFAQILVHLPSSRSDCERVTNEFAGNFLITNNNIPSAKDESQSMILWQSDGMLPISGTVSVYNSTSSTEAITIEIVGAVTNIFTVFPGNTISYTGKDLQSVNIANINIILHYI